jgi:aspartate ammonia-lyase
MRIHLASGKDAWLGRPVQDAGRIRAGPLLGGLPDSVAGMCECNFRKFLQSVRREQAMIDTTTRLEHDLLGDLAVPADAYYGVHTMRAVENFPISDTPISIYPDLIRALACIKQAAALANHELGLLDAERTDAIVRACEEIRAGRLHDQFIVDVIQGGAGTSTNMNANEVIANRALEFLGRPRGDYGYLHPNEHVNFGQSTNDVYPTAIKVALHFAIMRLVEAMVELRRAFEAKAEQFADILKMGRTQLQDAVPMTLGQEFGAYAVMVGEDEERLKEASLLIREINLGATAIGTGINAHPDYAALVCRRLAEITGIPLITAQNLVEATQDAGAFVQVSGVLKRVAVKLSKICNDLRLLSSGPRAGLNEINLPPRQAGSSIMPGKVNPVIPEVVNQIAFEVIGNDVAVSFAAEAGQLQLNAFEPIIAHSLFESLKHLRRGIQTLTERCVRGITANREHLRAMVENSIGLVTALNPFIGYANATAVAQEALASGASIYDLVLAKGLLAKETLDDILRPEMLTKPRPLSVQTEVLGKRESLSGGPEDVTKEVSSGPSGAAAESRS